MPRPFTRAQALQNAAFLRALARTGNAREAARAIDAHRSTFTKRRARDAAFAAEWDAALALAHAALHGGGAGAGQGAPGRLVRTAAGRWQLRRSLASSLTRAHEQAFLAALSASANVRLSAAATGFSHSAFYLRARVSPGFAREWRLALETGYDRIELALLESAQPDAYVDDHWRYNDPPPLPPMRVDEALQLFRLHQKAVRLDAEPPHLKRRRGETAEAQSHRMACMYEARIARAREAYRIAEADRAAARERPGPHEPPPPALPDLAQVAAHSRLPDRKAR